MAVERKVFRGVGAVIASVTDDSVFKVMPILDVNSMKVDFTKPQRLIDVDLKLTPRVAGPANWASVLYDDRGIDAARNPLPTVMSIQFFTKRYPVTSLGSGPLGAMQDEQLESGCLVGAVYIEDNHFNGLLAKINDGQPKPWPTPALTKVELTTIHYSNDAAKNGAFANKRYGGFLVKLKKRSGTFVQIEVFKSVGGAHRPQRTFWVDTTSPDEFEPAPPNDGEPLLDANTPVGAKVGVYLELGLVASMDLESPKIPIGLGG